MTEAVMELMNCMISLLRKQQAYLKEAMALLQDICQDMHQLMDQSQKDEVKIRELQEQIRKWKIFCSDLSEQNEVLVKQNQELQGLKELWMKLRQSRNFEQGGSLAGYDEGGTIGSIGQREAGNPYLVHTEDLIETIECQIERRKRDAAYALGRDGTEVREREVRIR